MISLSFEKVETSSLWIVHARTSVLIQCNSTVSCWNITANTRTTTRSPWLAINAKSNRPWLLRLAVQYGITSDHWMHLHNGLYRPRCRASYDSKTDGMFTSSQPRFLDTSTSPVVRFLSPALLQRVEWLLFPAYHRLIDEEKTYTLMITSSWFVDGSFSDQRKILGRVTLSQLRMVDRVLYTSIAN